MSSPQYHNYMAPFWDFIADLEERGHANQWFGPRAGPNRGMNRRGNRAAQAGETTEGNANMRPNAWTQAPAGFGPVPHRFRGGHGHGPRHGRRHQHETAVPEEQTRVMTPETEKEVENEKVLFDAVQSEGENVTSEKQTQRGPGARRGGRAGRGGRGAGLGRARRAAAAAEGNDAEKNVAVQSGDEKAVPANEGRRQGGPRRAGRGGPRGGRGLGRGAGRGAGQGMGPRRAARIAAAYEQMMAGPYGAFFGPMGGMPAARRGGPGFGRGNGFGPHRARQGFAGPHAFGGGFHFGPHHGPHHGPGAHRGGPHGRAMGAGRGCGAGMGRGRGAAFAARGVDQANAPGLRGGAGRFGNGPAMRPGRAGPGPAAGRPNQCPRKAAGLRNAGPKKNGPFRPLVDVYNHPEAFIIHASLPGAKKEDIEVNWDSEKSVIIITGEIHRQSGEELQKTLTRKERRIGAFKRQVRLGNKAKPATIEVDDITAKIEDGVLKIDVPKTESAFVEVKKVDIN